MQTQLLSSGNKPDELAMYREQIAGKRSAVLYYPSASLEGSGSSKKVDIDPDLPKIVANKQQSMEELVIALERALLMAKQPSAKADAVISYTREQFENIQNPHRALEQELARLVEARTPPNDEFYSTRHDKSELAVAFFHRVYGRFYNEGVLYKHQLRAIDASLLNMLGHYSAEVQLKTKKDFNTTIASRAMTVADSVKTAVLSVSRRQYA